jgi:NADPH:quinone reductase-like Zn-dependent oxidoreductase
MKAIEISGAFGINGLRLADRPEPVPGSGQLLLGMRAASLNYRDWLMVTGQYNPRQPLPLIPCSDGVGEVLGCGDGVIGFSPGDRVLPIFAPLWIDGKPTKEKLRTTLGGPLDGVLAQRMIVDASSVVHAPVQLDDVEAACLPCAGVTAWNALVVHGELAAGDKVLVQGSGGVSIFALQIAHALGAEVWAISSRDECLEKMRALGAVETLNYKKVAGWGQAIRKRSGGIDLVVDIGGGATLPQSLAAVGLGGRICQVGNLGGGTVSLNLVSLFMQQVRLQGMLVGDRASFQALNSLVETRNIRPVIDRTFPWTDAGQALEYLSTGQQFGKICLRIEE